MLSLSLNHNINYCAQIFQISSLDPVLIDIKNEDGTKSKQEASTS